MTNVTEVNCHAFLKQTLFHISFKIFKYTTKMGFKWGEIILSLWLCARFNSYMLCAGQNKTSRCNRAVLWLWRNSEWHVWRAACSPLSVVENGMLLICLIYMWHGDIFDCLRANWLHDMSPGMCQAAQQIATKMWLMGCQQIPICIRWL